MILYLKKGSQKQGTPSFKFTDGILGDISSV